MAEEHRWLRKHACFSSANLKQYIRRALKHKLVDFQQPFEGMANTLRLN
jgi:hypothetical protein